MEPLKERVLTAALERESERLARSVGVGTQSTTTHIDCWNTDALPSSKPRARIQSTYARKRRLPVLKDLSSNQLDVTGHDRRSSLQDSGLHPTAVPENSGQQPVPTISNFCRTGFRIRSLVTGERRRKKRTPRSFQLGWHTPLPPRNCWPYNSFEFPGRQLFAPSRVLRSSAGSRRKAYK